jgi:hypothetical protein
MYRHSLGPEVSKELYLRFEEQPVLSSDYCIVLVMMNGNKEARFALGRQA